MERYDICPIDGVLMPDETGDWVKFEEANARIKELEEALKYVYSDLKQGAIPNDLTFIENAIKKP